MQNLKTISKNINFNWLGFFNSKPDCTISKVSTSLLIKKVLIVLSAIFIMKMGFAQSVNFESTTSGQSTGTNLTFQHDAGTAANRLVLVSVQLGRETTISGNVTYAGQTMTLVGQSVEADRAIVIIYSLTNPPSGNQNIVINVSGSNGIVAGAVSFSNVNQAAPLRPYVGTNGNATTSSVTVQTGPGEIVFGAISHASNTTVGDATGQVERWRRITNTNADRAKGKGSTKAIASGATTTFGFNNHNGRFAMGAVSVRPIPCSASSASSSPSVCLGSAIPNITHTTFGATGIGTPIGLPAGVSASFASNTITISGTPSASGTFNYTIPLTGGDCSGFSATGTIRVAALPNIPSTLSVTQPTCAIPSGTIIINTQSNVQYSVDNGVTYQSSPIFSGLAPGVYTLRVRNITTNCSRQGSSTVTINAVPSPPLAPTTANIIQPTCALPSGTIEFNTQPNVEYSVNNGSTYQISPVFSGLAPGIYTLRVRSSNDNTCSTHGTSSITINPPPPQPVIGGATSVILNNSENITPSSGGTWSSSNPSIATIDNNGLVTGVSQGTVVLSFTETSTGCVSSILFEVIDNRLDLSIVKTVNNNMPSVNSNVIFTLTATNNGPLDATGVIVNDLLPSGYAFVNANPSIGTYDVGTGVWSIGNLNNGSSATLEITVTVLSSGNYLNITTIDSDFEDFFTVNNIHLQEVIVTFPPINIVACINQPFDLTSIVVNNLPSGTTVAFHNSTPPSSANLVSNPTTVTVPGTYFLSFYNSTEDCYSEANVVNLLDVCEVNLEVEKIVSNATPFVGDNVTFTITVRNMGIDNGTGVQVNDLLPSGYTYVSDNGTGSYNPVSGIWTIGNLANGASISLQIVATVNETGNYTNTAVVSGNENDPNLTNNTSSVSTNPVNVIVAINDTFDCANGNAGQNALINVLNNDSINGNVLNASLVNVTTLSADAGLVLQSNGNVDVLPGTTEGVYTLTYRICEIINPTNCDDAIVSISIAPFISFVTTTVLSDCGANDGTIQIAGLIPSETYTLSVNSINQVITPATTNFIITNLPDGSYNISVQNSNNCLSNVLTNIQILEPGPPPPPSGIGCD